VTIDPAKPKTRVTIIPAKSWIMVLFIAAIWPPGSDHHRHGGRLADRMQRFVRAP
jgi:hypothetical protein